MNAYIDASVILSEVLHQEHRLPEWQELVVGVTSELARVECLRTLDRFRVEHILADQAIAEARERLVTVFQGVDLLPLNAAVLTRAAEPLLTSLGTLDAIHLATAQIYREAQSDDEPPIFFATFDRALARAADATGFRVLGPIAR